MDLHLITLEILGTLRDALVKQMLLDLEPHLQTTEYKGKAFVFRDAEGRNYPQSVKASSLPPLYGFSTAGVYFNGYGNLAVRPWDEVGVEDVLRIKDMALSQVTQVTTLTPVAA